MPWKRGLLLVLLSLLPGTAATCNCHEQTTTTTEGTEHRQRSAFDLDETSFEGSPHSSASFAFKAFRTLHFHNATEPRDVLELGTIVDAFVGPRRRRSVTSWSPYATYSIPKRRNHGLQKGGVKVNVEPSTSPQHRFRASDAAPLLQIQKIFKPNNFYVQQQQHERPAQQQELGRREGNIPPWQQMAQNIQRVTTQPLMRAALMENEIIPHEDTLEKNSEVTLGNVDVTGHSTIQPMTASTIIQPMTASTIIQPMRSSTADLLNMRSESKRMGLVAEEIAIASALQDYGPGVREIPRHGQYPSRNAGGGDWLQFQPMPYEWSREVGEALPEPHPTTEEPGFLTRFLSTYINFELNNYEVTEFVRKLTFALLLISLGIAWVLFGIFLGVIPHKWLSWHTQRNLEEESIWPNAIIKGFTERVSLALDGDWLEKLEKRVSGGGGGWLATSVSCCILPNEKSLGQAECEVVRKGRKVSTFKCLSDLIYNFNFGPSES